MRFSSLVVAVLLAVTSSLFAQHSTAASSTNFSGGGSHSGSVGSSSGSYLPSSQSLGSSAFHSSGAQLAHSMPSGLNIQQTERQPSATATGSQSEKRGFFSLLAHPSRVSAPMLETSLRLPICKTEPCRLPICPPRQSLNGNGVCAVTSLRASTCQTGNYWTPGPCASIDTADCLAFALALDRLAWFPDEEARQAKIAMLEQQYAQCLTLQSLFSLHWAGNSPGSSFASFPFDNWWVSML
jgi:hypothetical protein